MERYVIHVTKRCNLDCFYCYEDNKSSTYSWSDVKKLIDEIINSTNERFGVEFLGGEPCLEIGLISKSIDYINESTTLCDSFVITSNGTIVNDDLIALMKNNKNLHLGISMDGTKHMNQLRVFKESKNNCYDAVVENIKTLIENGLQNQFGVHMVIHLFNVNLLHIGVLHLEHLGVKNIGVGTIEKTMTIDEEYRDRFVVEFLKISKDVIDGKIKARIDLISNLKPKSDVRHYIYDESGIVIAETYGRAKDDIVKKNKNYKIEATHSPIGDMIYEMREEVYLNHRRLMEIKS